MGKNPYEARARAARATALADTLDQAGIHWALAEQMSETSWVLADEATAARLRFQGRTFHRPSSPETREAAIWECYRRAMKRTVTRIPLRRVPDLDPQGAA